MHDKERREALFIVHQRKVPAYFSSAFIRRSDVLAIPNAKTSETSPERACKRKRTGKSRVIYFDYADRTDTTI